MGSKSSEALKLLAKNGGQIGVKISKKFKILGKVRVWRII
jgi:hypothetical protein